MNIHGTIRNVLPKLRKLAAGYIQIRLTWYFLLILLPLAALSLFAIAKSQAIVQDQTSQRSEGALHTMADYVDSTLQNIEQLSTLIAFDMNINTTLQAVGKVPGKQAYVQFAQVMDQLTSMTSVNLMIDQIAVIHMPSRTVISTKDGGRKLPEGAEKQLWYRQLMESGGGTIYFSPKPGESYLDADSVHLVRTMDPYNRTIINPSLLVVSIKKSSLVELAKPLLPSPQTNIFFFGNDGGLIAGTGPGDRLPGISDGETTTIRKAAGTDTDMVTISVKSKYAGWSLLMEQPLREIRRHTDTLKAYTYGILAASLVLAVMISWIVYRGISAPLRKLAYGMKQLRTGHYAIQLEERRVDELGYVVESFNKLAENQKTLIRDHYEKQLLLSKMEIKFLQSQINPHFLYNTLDSIYWAAKNYEADEISDMVLNLSKFFRLSLNKGNESFSVAETIEHLQYYIKVQQLRFLDHFVVRFDIAEESKPYHVLKLLLQPLVENAVLHGLEKQTGGGELVIASRLEAERLVLEVSDNGAGMGTDKLMYIRSKLDEAWEQAAEGISTNLKGDKDLFGLRNVVTRTRMYYGAESAYAFDSDAGAGTRMTLRLPLDICAKSAEDAAS